MEITKETRKESHILTDKKTRYNDILKVLGDKEMTSNEIKKALGFKDLNAVRPRITELKNKGVIEAVGKKYDKETERNVAVFRRAEQWQEQKK